MTSIGGCLRAPRRARLMVDERCPPSERDRAERLTTQAAGLQGKLPAVPSDHRSTTSSRPRLRRPSRGLIPSP